MPRPSRPLTPVEIQRPCPLCGARPGQRCTNPNSTTYPHGEHASRRHGIAHRRLIEGPFELDREYTVQVCRRCEHPAGQHILNGGCKLCAECAGWKEGGNARWTDRMTDEALAEYQEKRNPVSEGEQ